MRSLIVIVFLLLASPLAAQTRDTYLGVAGAPCSGGATGFFYVEKQANKRWVLCTPEGNASWLLSVYSMAEFDGGTTLQEKIVAKYAGGAPEWMEKGVARITDWYFNAIGELSDRRVLPDPTSGFPTGNAEKAPYTLVARLAFHCLKSNTESDPYPSKNIIKANSALSGYNGGGFFPDVFDSEWANCVTAYFANGLTEPLLEPFTDLSTSPWLIGVSVSDRDQLRGFGDGPDANTDKCHPHLGWITAITTPTQSYENDAWAGPSQIDYPADQANNTKAQLQTFLQGRYATIGDLNTAWGSNYTTWDSSGTATTNESIGTGDGSTVTFNNTLVNTPVSEYSMVIEVDGVFMGGDQGAGSLGGDGISSGTINYSTGAISVTFSSAPANLDTITVDYVDTGWAQGGTGFMDTDGRSAQRTGWLGTESCSLTGADTDTKTDLDDFLESISDKYFSVTSTGVNNWTRGGWAGNVGDNHMIFTPMPLQTGARPQILTGACPYVDALQLAHPPGASVDEPSGYASQISTAYASCSKPFFFWMTVQSMEDSGRTSTWTYDSYNSTTQEGRADNYETMMNDLWNAQAADGSFPSIGIDWWAFVDKVVGGEENNFGLISPLDNSYDGNEDVSATVDCSDPPGATYSCGGEAANYGDFLTKVRQVNQEIYNRLLAAFGPNLRGKVVITGRVKVQ